MVDVTEELGTIKGQLDSINTNVGAIATRLQTQSNQIQVLTAELAAAGTITPEQQAALDAIRDESTAIASATSALVPPAPTA